SVRVARKSRSLVAQRVEYDEIEIFAAHFLQGVAAFVVRFEGETDQQSALLDASDLRCDVLRASEADDHVAVALFDFGRTHFGRRIVGYRRTHYCAVRLRKPFHDGPV